MSASDYHPCLELTRGEVVESIHFGAIAVVDTAGRLVAGYGNANTCTYLRSTAKPFQALPFIERGGHLAYDLSLAEIALLCASHSGTDQHVATVQAIQAKTGVLETSLLCGTHPPIHEPTAQVLQQRGENPGPNRHNCSGKHTGMLAFARLEGWPEDDYIDPDHPVQQAILDTFAEMCNLPKTEIEIGIDGCSAPNFAVPLRSAALAYARLCDPNGLHAERAEACRAITVAMTAHPEMVGGPDRFDTCLMQVTRGRLLAKAGAEGYQGIGLLPDALGRGSPALGIALKISDGDLKGRARPAVVLEVLNQLGAFSSEELEALSQFGPRLPIYNWRKLAVGEARPCFQLEHDGR
jgi:L-asparaginase II